MWVAAGVRKIRRFVAVDVGTVADATEQDVIARMLHRDAVEALLRLVRFYVQAVGKISKDAHQN